MMSQDVKILQSVKHTINTPNYEIIEKFTFVDLIDLCGQWLYFSASATI
jgi:hypothetical protein